MTIAVCPYCWVFPLLLSLFINIVRVSLVILSGEGGNKCKWGKSEPGIHVLGK